VGRYGGDEFVVILRGADSRRARDLAEQLRRKVHRTTFLAEPRPGGLPALRLHGISASFGVAALHEHVALAGPPEWRRNALFRQADTAMYRAKALGRNRVEVAEAERVPQAIRGRGSAATTPAPSRRGRALPGA
jgi:diguanylate cyclase (GGDEF)-like protein